jgi:hypothetical protein
MKSDLKDQLIKYSSLEVNISNSLTFLLDNYNTMSKMAVSASIFALINQLEINSKYFNDILDTIQDND